MKYLICEIEFGYKRKFPLKMLIISSDIILSHLNMFIINYPKANVMLQVGFTLVCCKLLTKKYVRRFPVTVYGNLLTMFGKL